MAAKKASMQGEGLWEAKMEDDNKFDGPTVTVYVDLK
jgi:hypothetical protein